MKVKALEETFYSWQRECQTCAPLNSSKTSTMGQAVRGGAKVDGPSAGQAPSQG